MKKIGFLTSKKENENRIAILPKDIYNVKNRNQIFIENGYAEKLGIKDEEYVKLGCKIEHRDEIIKKDIICDAKIGDSEELVKINNKIIFGWIHAVQNKEITDILIKNKLTAYAWEDMYENGRHVFWRNNELAGEAAVMNSLLCYGKLPSKSKVAILGNGNSARGAFRIFNQLGAEVQIYTRKMEGLFKKEMESYDIIVNAVLWDTNRKDHIIYKDDLKRLKTNAMIVDISCDRNGAIETSIPTTIKNPTYQVDGITHYVVDHTPSLLYKTASEEISREVAKYIDYLIEDKKNDILDRALIVLDGDIKDQRINEYQKRKNV